jgi:hypothetical protein
MTAIAFKLQAAGNRQYGTAAIATRITITSASTLASEQLTDARGGRVEGGRVGDVGGGYGRQHRLEQAPTSDEIEVRAGRHVEPGRDPEPGTGQPGQRDALAADHRGRRVRIAQRHDWRHPSIHEIPPLHPPFGPNRQDCMMPAHSAGREATPMDISDAYVIAGRAKAPETLRSRGTR